MAAVVSRPLYVAPVENAGRLMCIYSELKGWQNKANERKGAFWYGFEDFGSLNRDEGEALDNYYTIAQKLAEVVSSKQGHCGDEAYQRFKEHTILAAYDKEGNLQGVAAAKKVSKTGIAAKVDFIVTAFWNMPFKEPKNEMRTRGAGTCLLGRLTEIYPGGAIYLEPTEEAVAFYTNRFCTTVPDWKPKTEGAVCGMFLARKNAVLLKRKTESQLISCDESDLPFTIRHYLEYLSKEDRKLAVESVTFDERAEAT